MENETFTFDDWLDRVVRNNGHDLRSILNTFSRRVEGAFGTQLWFAEILGRRWSYMTGTRAVRPVCREMSRIRLAPGLGMVVNDWGELTPGQRTRLIVFIEELVAHRCSSQLPG